MGFILKGRKGLSVVLLIALIAAMFYADMGTAHAATVTEDGNFQYSISGGYVTIDKYLGTEKNVVIPEKIGDFPVKTVGRYAFADSGIESITGVSVTKLMGNSFARCRNLIDVSFPALEIVGTMYYNGIYWGAFYECSSLVELDFPLVTSIDIYSFVGCNSLKIINAPSLEHLTEYTFTSKTHNNGSINNLQSIESIFLPCVLYNENREKIENGKYEGYGDSFHSGYAFKPTHKGVWNVVTPATCTAVGEKERVCTICKTKETAEIPIDSTAHSYGEWQVTKEATCTSVGEKERACSACNNKETSEVAIDPTAHSFTNYVYNKDAKVGVDGTETAVCDNGCGAKDTRTKTGTALSGGGGGGYIPTLPTAPTIQKPEISTGDGYTATLGTDGTSANITVQEGYELVDVIVNGVSKGKVTVITGLKTGDKIAVKVSKKEELSTEEKVQAELATVTVDNFKARSKQVKLKNGKKAVKITWSNTSGVKFDGVEIFRSVKRYSGYGKKAIFTTESDKYYNTSVKAGTKYYYKVRGYIEVDGIKYYSSWSKKAWRTVK